MCRLSSGTPIRLIYLLTDIHIRIACHYSVVATAKDIATDVSTVNGFRHTFVITRDSVIFLRLELN